MFKQSHPSYLIQLADCVAFSLLKREVDARSLEVNWTRAGQKEMAFTAPVTTAWKSGEYRAELWVADKKVQQAQFDIEAAEQTEHTQ